MTDATTGGISEHELDVAETVRSSRARILFSHNECTLAALLLTMRSLHSRTVLHEVLCVICCEECVIICIPALYKTRSSLVPWPTPGQHCYYKRSTN